jgi:hypothetical protein
LLRWLVAHAIRNTSQQAVQDVAKDAVRTAQDSTRQVLPLEVESFPPVDALVLFALSVESSPFIAKLETPRRFRWEKTKGVIGKLGERYVAVLHTGVGTSAAGKLVEKIGPALPSESNWISSGFAGGLVPELKRGDLLMANTPAKLAPRPERYSNVPLPRKTCGNIAITPAEPPNDSLDF